VDINIFHFYFLHKKHFKHKKLVFKIFNVLNNCTFTARKDGSYCALNEHFLYA